VCVNGVRKKQKKMFFLLKRLIHKYVVVAGKSFVIHSADDPSLRVACADIIPVNGVSPLTMNFEKHAFVK
jgi:hypothetical protein